VVLKVDSGKITKDILLSLHGLCNGSGSPHYVATAPYHHHHHQFTFNIDILKVNCRGLEKHS
jgi:hypothetical protein